MIYIQSDSERKIPHHFDCACAMYGAIDSAQEYRLTSFEEVESGKFDLLLKKHLFVGSVEFMREVFKRAYIRDPRVPVNSNRTHSTSDIRDIRDRVSNGEQMFVKPFKIKLFTGLVADKTTINCLDPYDENEMVMVYEPFKSKIESEWRVYVKHDMIEDSHNYSGDVRMNPKYDLVEKAIEENKNTFPHAYTIDVGILETGENVIVEYNDMWAIGNYGVPNGRYLEMLRIRYFEIIRSNAR